MPNGTIGTGARAAGGADATATGRLACKSSSAAATWLQANSNHGAALGVRLWLGARLTDAQPSSRSMSAASASGSVVGA